VGRRPLGRLRRRREYNIKVFCEIVAVYSENHTRSKNIFFLSKRPVDVVSCV
jgi:hypothetical protein